MATYQEQLEKIRSQKETKAKAEAEEQARLLSPEQVGHWRIVLANMGIPFARSMPAEMVQRFRDAIQARIDGEHPSS